jgi:hypothetical protein
MDNSFFQTPKRANLQDNVERSEGVWDQGQMCWTKNELIFPGYIRTSKSETRGKIYNSFLPVLNWNS